eukprot:15334917-Ditylum_brightwellii.AAC.1
MQQKIFLWCLVECVVEAIRNNDDDSNSGHGKVEIYDSVWHEQLEIAPDISFHESQIMMLQNELEVPNIEDYLAIMRKGGPLTVFEKAVHIAEETILHFKQSNVSVWDADSDFAMNVILTSKDGELCLTNSSGIEDCNKTHNLNGTSNQINSLLYTIAH